MRGSQKPDGRDLRIPKESVLNDWQQGVICVAYHRAPIGCRSGERWSDVSSWIGKRYSCGNETGGNVRESWSLSWTRHGGSGISR